MAHNTLPSKLWLPCGGTRCTLQALILSTLVVLLASSMAAVVVGTTPETTQPPSGGGDCHHYRFELTHVDANLSISSDELMRRAYERSRLRAATLYGTAADFPAAAAGGSSDSDSGSPVGSPGFVSQGDSVYIIKFLLGNRGDIIYATVDTGSNLIWTTQKGCLLSTTKSVVPCSSPICEQQANSQCSGTNMCKYKITYGGDKGTQTVGFLYKNKLTFLLPQKQTFENVAIGCSTPSTTTVKFSDPRIKGIVGLGRSAESLPGQLNFNKFSYCLSSYYKPDLPSYLLLTTAPSMATGARSGATVATTGLRQRNDKTRYYVDLEAISIDGTRLDTTTAGGGNMFVDSGTSFTLLEESVFNKLVAEVNKTMQAKQYSVEQSEDGNICYSPSSPTTPHPDESMLPQMVLHLADSADMVLPPDSYLWYTTKSPKLCLAILKSATPGMSVLGNFQMQGIHMLFDTQNDKLSFVPADCSKV